MSAAGRVRTGVSMILVVSAVVACAPQRPQATSGGTPVTATESPVIASAPLAVQRSLPVASQPANPPSPGSPRGERSSTPSPSPAAAAGGLPDFSHVYVIVMENTDLSEIDARTAPYIASLMTRYASATQYTAVAHPSEPNYLALFSGSTQGVSDDGVHDIAAPTLADQLEAAGREWRVYAENVPGGCFTGAVASGGPDGPGTYARKHEPAISFSSIRGDPGRCARIQDFSHLDPAAGPFELIVPNLCHDMHDCSIPEGDAFLASLVPRILEGPAWDGRSVLFIVFDEGHGSEPIPFVVVGPVVRPGFRSAVPHDHYSLLRTIENAWGLPCLASACRANTLAELFGPN